MQHLSFVLNLKYSLIYSLILVYIVGIKANTSQATANTDSWAMGLAAQKIPPISPAYYNMTANMINQMSINYLN